MTSDPGFPQPAFYYSIQAFRLQQEGIVSVCRLQYLQFRAGNMESQLLLLYNGKQHITTDTHNENLLLNRSKNLFIDLWAPSCLRPLPLGPFSLR